MKKISVLALAVLFVVASLQNLSAAVRSWELDTAHSNFYFTIDHIFSKIRGHFNEYSGEVVFDPADLAGSRLFFEIKTASVDTNIPKRDKHLQSADFFDAAKYPTMTFVSQQITDLGDNHYDVAGKFTIKGVEYDLVLPLTLVGVKDHPTAKGKKVAGFNGAVTIDRLVHQVGSGKFYEMGVVGKDVEILVSLEVLSGE
jgi:polyisoprenoid-binding protein YceI